MFSAPPAVEKLLALITVNGTTTTRTITNDTVLKAVVTLEEGSRMVLQCFWREGNPPQNVKLIKDGVDQLPVTERPLSKHDELRRLDYEMKSVSCQDAGTFSCVTEGASSSQSLQLGVPCK
jgi:hypothetical protein